MPVLASLRLLVILAAGIAAVIVAVHLAAGAPAASIVSWGPPPSTSPAPSTLTLPSSPTTGHAATGSIPNLGQRINDETGAVARGQMSILDELEKAIADQIRGIIQRVEPR